MAETMLNIEHVKTIIDNFKKEVKNIQVYLKDETFSLDDRWQLYILIQPFLKTDGVYMDFKSIEKRHGEISWYDDFYLDRHAVRQLDNDFINLVQELNWGVDIFELQEEILSYGAKGYGAFENDW